MQILKLIQHHTLINSPKKSMKISMVVASAILSIGCSSVHKFPDNGQDIKQVYDSHISGMQSNNPTGLSTQTISAERKVNNGRVDLGPYTRSEHNELDNLFPLLPNPQLVMYVDPHLSKKGHPVPGYSVPFKLYEKDEYALPGEIKQ